MYTITENVDLTPFNTFRVAAKADRMVVYDSPADLHSIFSPGSGLPLSPCIHIGGGSNLLFCGDYHGTVLFARHCTHSFHPIDESTVRMTAEAGMTLDDAVKAAVAEGLWGLENLADIPGQVGAAAVQNVGAYGVEFADIVESVECFDTIELTEIVFSAAECGYGYRSSRFKEADKGRYIVTRVNLRLSSVPAPVLTYGPLRDLPADVSPAEVERVVRSVRGSKLPAVSEKGSAGSFFKNPVVDAPTYRRACEMSCLEPAGYPAPDGSVKVSAAWLIDHAGMKGAAFGGAATWPSQPLVIVNMTGDASAADIVALERMIVDRVKQKFGIELHPEVEHIGL